MRNSNADTLPVDCVVCQCGLYLETGDVAAGGTLLIKMILLQFSKITASSEKQKIPRVVHFACKRLKDIDQL